MVCIGHLRQARVKALMERTFCSETSSLEHFGKELDKESERTPESPSPHSGPRDQ